jgi:regulator of sirC expression with transglutaminase-like and TPR domain
MTLLKSALLSSVAWSLFLVGSNFTFAQDPDKAKPKPAKKPAAKTETTAVPVSAEKLAKWLRPSIVVVTFAGRDGKQLGLGTGFVVSKEGLIATNLHVIGEARPISVMLADGKVYPVTTIHATQKSMDLAILKIDAKGLVPLKLAVSKEVQQGRPVVALGNPHGLKFSVVSGVISGRREIDGKPMFQMAIPIEPGNSGGPLVDLEGRVVGVMTMKSLVTRNLGFAVEIDALKPLLEKPNPVPIARWLTIGALDKREWTTLFGSDWRQRAGRLLVHGRGGGFGGRSLCLSTKKTPKLPFELAVTVKLKSEDGAAGLVFHSDDNNKHYGFYPTGGKLRLARFEGADVFSWNVLQTVPSQHYRPGEWNTLKVRIEKGRIRCFVNEEQVIDSRDAGFSSGRVGLAKFRETQAEFKRFRMATKLPSDRPSEETVKRIAKLVAGIDITRPPKDELVGKLSGDGVLGTVALADRAKQLEQEAKRLRELAREVHRRTVQRDLSKLLEADEEKIDLLQAALLIARIDNDEIEVDAYLAEVDRIVADIRETLKEKADEAAKLAAVDKVMFQELGFHGSRTNYYNSSNSYLNEVIDDREGLPITLSVLYMEIARRVGVNVVGVGLPGHFVVRHEPKTGKKQLIDPFDGGKRLSRKEADEMVKSMTGRPLEDRFLATQSKRDILVRMLHNLFGLARNKQDVEPMLSYVDTIILIDPDVGLDRWFRAVLRFQTKRHAEALVDTAWLLKHEPEGVSLPQVAELQRILEKALKE